MLYQIHVSILGCLSRFPEMVLVGGHELTVAVLFINNQHSLREVREAVEDLVFLGHIEKTSKTDDYLADGTATRATCYRILGVGRIQYSKYLKGEEDLHV